MASDDSLGEVYPTMITPFTPDGSAVDYEALGKLTEWYMEAGCAGCFHPCQSSEMFLLTNDERLQCAERVKAHAGDRTVMSCGTFEGSVEEQAEFVNELGMRVDVVVVIVSMMAKEDESDEVLMANLRKLMELTGDVKLGLYECPKPYHRLLTPAMLKEIAESGRFVFHKDTSRDNEVIRTKLAALEGLKTPFRFYNGNVGTLYPSLVDGAHGFSGISANFYPWMHVWLVKNFKTEEEKAIKVHRFLAVAENTAKDLYPLSAKVYQAMFYGCKPSPSRAVTATLNAEQTLKLQCLHDMMLDVAKEVGITPLPDLEPATVEAPRGLVWTGQGMM